MLKPHEPTVQPQYFGDMTGHLPLYSRSGVILVAVDKHDDKERTIKTAGSTYMEGLTWLRDDPKAKRGHPENGGRLDAVRTSTPVIQQDGRFYPVLDSRNHKDERFEPISRVGEFLFVETPTGSVPRKSNPFRQPNKTPWFTPNKATVAGARIPDGIPGIMVRGMEEQSQELSVYPAWTNVLVSERRKPANASTLVADTDGKSIDHGHIAPLNSALTVEQNESGRMALALTFDDLGGKGRGLFSEGSQLAYLSDVVSAGRGRLDPHQYGVNAEGKPVNFGHFRLTAPWDHPFGDGFPDVSNTPLVGDLSKGTPWKTFLRHGPNSWAWQTHVPVATDEPPEDGWRLESWPIGFGGGGGAGSAGRPVTGGGLSGSGGQGRGLVVPGSETIPCPPKGGIGAGGFNAGGNFGGVTDFPPIMPTTPIGPDINVAGDDSVEALSETPLDAGLIVNGTDEIVSTSGEDCPKPVEMPPPHRFEVNGQVANKPVKKRLASGHFDYMQRVGNSMVFVARDSKGPDLRFNDSPTEADLRQVRKAPKVIQVEGFGGKTNNRFVSNSTPKNTRYRTGEAAGGLVIMPPTHDLDRMHHNQPDAPPKTPVVMHWDTGQGFGTFAKNGCPKDAMVWTKDAELGLILTHWDSDSNATEILRIGTDGTVHAGAFVEL